MSGLLIASCRSGRTYNMVSGGAAALERTHGVTAEVSPGDAARMQEGVERFLGLFAAFDRETVEVAAREVYASDAYFNDGFAELEGQEAIAAYLARTAAATAEIEVLIEDRVTANGEVYLRWVMRFTTRGARGRTIVAPGMTHLRLDRDGRVVYHRDHWDGSGALAELVPLLGPALRAVRRRVESG